VSRFQVEALLRPPVELWSALVAATAAVIALSAPWALMMPPDVAYATAGVLTLLAAVRARQGWRVVRYQRHLKRLPNYRLCADRIPVSRHKLFLGRGFRWTQRHTQRLRDTLRPEVQHYVQSGRLQRWLQHKIIAWDARPSLRIIARWLRQPSRWNPWRPQPAVGGLPALHAVEPYERPVWMDLGERVGHTLVLGTTRVGKTRLAEVLITQDIARGDVVIVFDPKGDADLLRRIYAEAQRAGRLDDFTLFHLGFPEVSARYNAIGSFSRITEVATRIANQLPSEGNSAAFKEFAWRFVNIIAHALVALGRRPDYAQIRRYINDIEPLFVEYARDRLQRTDRPDWQAEVKAVEDAISERNLSAALRGRGREAIALLRYLQPNAIDDPVLEGLLSAFKYDKTYFDKIVSSVGPLMEKLTTGRIAELISPDYLDDDRRPIFSWLDVIRRQGIVYIGLDALSDTTVASAVGNAMFADLVSVAGHLYKHGITHTDDPTTQTKATRLPTLSLHADEFNELIGDEFIPLLNKAGGAGFQVTAYTQTWSDVEARLGNRAKAGQVAGNFNTLIMLRVKELATAEMLTNQLPRVEVTTLMTVSGVSDSSDPGSGTDFQSRNEDRLSVSEVPMLTPADLVRLPKGQAFALLEGGALWKLRMPLPDGDDPMMPPDLAAIADTMTRTYRTQEHWARHQETWWHGVPDVEVTAVPNSDHDA
jgi:conjugative coupling factor TraD (TOL family)